MRRRIDCRWLLLLGVATVNSLAAAGDEPPATPVAAQAANSPGPQTEQDEPVTGMRFVALPKGCYAMGSAGALHPKTDIRWRHIGYTGHLAADEMPKHEVCLDAFWIGKHEVSADQWQKITGSPPPAGDGKHPAGGMSWESARRFAAALTDQSGGDFTYRLPTEAEWEYACRAGQAADGKPDRKQPIETAWYNHWSGDKGYVALDTAEIGSLPPNAWGLHDMLGNVWEWTEDSYAANAYTRHPLFNPRTTTGASSRVIRGASYRSEYIQMRCATRSSLEAKAAMPQVGLRLVRVPREAR